MKNTTPKKLALPVIALLILFVLFSTAHSQPGCPFPDSVPVGHLPKGITVYYVFSGIIGSQKTQIETAFGIWESTNTSLQNCSSVSFAAGPAPAGRGSVTITISN
ncbi:hypothetical protein BH24ACI1_BH24ACI1_07670 [soil metagenome]